MHDNEAIVRTFFEEAFNRGRLDVIDTLFSPEFVEHQAFGPDAPAGRDAPKAVVTSLRRGFSDFHITIEDTAASNDTVWVRLRATGTHDGPFMGHAPTGNRIAVTVIDIMRLAHGKIVEHWGVADSLAALRQIEAPHS